MCKSVNYETFMNELIINSVTYVDFFLLSSARQRLWATFMSHTDKINVKKEGRKETRFLSFIIFIRLLFKWILFSGIFSSFIWTYYYERNQKEIKKNRILCGLNLDLICSHKINRYTLRVDWRLFLYV